MKDDPSVFRFPTVTGRRLGRSAWGLSLVLALLAGQAHAHVSLDFPNGGEEFEVGEVVQLLWSDDVSHGPATYDLWYSTTGPDGPWIAIAGGIDPPRSFDWVVPDSPSSQVRVRVKQDNADEDYFDFSDSDLAIVSAAATVPIVLDAEKDATIHEEGNGTDANGSGSYLFTGRTASQGGSAERRALIAFPIAESIPEGSTIISVSLDLTMSKTISGAQNVGLHRLLEDWSEGPADPSGSEGGGTSPVEGDVTWVHREFPGVFWATPGATFEQTASATLQVSNVGGYTFSSTPGLVADVRAWLDDPSANFGWVLVMDSPATGSAKRFDSRENGSASTRPKLTVNYEADLQEPTAGFSFAPANPQPGEEVRFSDESTGEPTSWQWDFGDGQTSQEQNPTHVYATSGTRIAILVVSNVSGSDSVVKQVRIGTPVRRPSRRVAPTG